MKTESKEDRISITNPLPFVLGDINHHVDRVLRDKGITMSEEVSSAIMSFPKSGILDQFLDAHKAIKSDREKLLNALERAKQYAKAWQVRDIQPLLGEDLDADVEEFEALISKIRKQ